MPRKQWLPCKAQRQSAHWVLSTTTGVYDHEFLDFYKLTHIGTLYPHGRQTTLRDGSTRTGVCIWRGAPTQPPDPDIASQEPEPLTPALFANRLVELSTANPGASNLELSRLIRDILPPPGTARVRSQLPSVPRDPENESNESMWRRLRYEYIMLSTQARDGFSDEVLAWLSRVIDDWLHRL